MFLDSLSYFNILSIQLRKSDKRADKSPQGFILGGRQIGLLFLVGADLVSALPACLFRADTRSAPTDDKAL